MASLSLHETGILNGMGVARDSWKGVADPGLQSLPRLRRGSQPAAFQSYRRDSFTREPPVPSYRRSSISPQQPLPGYRRDSVTRETIQSSRRDSISRDPLQNYRRDSIISEPVDLVKEEVTRRRGSDADNINWIAKYQKSDHHTDRLVNTKLEHEKAIGRNFAAQVDQNIASLSRSPGLNPASVTNKLPPLNPFRYEGTNRLTVYLQPTKNDSLYRKPEEIKRSISQITSPTFPPISRNSGRIYSPSPTEIPGPRIYHYPAPHAGSMSPRVDRRGAFQRQSSTVGTSLPMSPVFRRRTSVDSSLIKTSRMHDLPNTLERGFSPATSLAASDFRSPSSSSSKYMTDPTRYQSYRPDLRRAPSLPPSLSAGNTAHGSSGGSRRPSFTNGVASDAFGRRPSLARLSDLSTSNYRRSLDFGVVKGIDLVSSRMGRLA